MWDISGMSAFAAMRWPPGELCKSPHSGHWVGHLAEEKSVLEEEAPETGALSSAKLFSSVSSTAAAVT